MPAYKILGSDGKEHGPISADGVRHWIANQRADGATSVQAEGTSDWQPLSRCPEFADALAGDPPGVEALPPAGPVKTNRLAIASLVCGVLGFLCLPALVGLILGSRALTQIKKSQGQLRGRGLAITGLSLSGFMLLVACPALTLSVMAIGQAKVEQINCLHQIRSIGLAMRLYSNDNNDVLPLDFLSLSNELSVPKILICPSDTQHTKATNWADFDPRRNVSYEFLHPGIAESNLLTAPQMILLRCPIHDNVCLGDGSWQMGAKPPGGGRPDKPR